MIRVPLKALHAQAKNRPSDYLETVLRAGRLDGDVLLLTEASHAALRARYNSASGSMVKSIPQSAWPLWAKTLLLVARLGEDSGLGDTIARVIGPVGGNAFKAWHQATFGKPCGCASRQARLNALYPLV